MQVRNSSKAAILAAVALVGFASQASAASYDWTLGLTGTQPWNAGNWGGVSFPNAVGDTANFVGDIAGNVSPRLDVDVTVGTLNISDTVGTPGNYAMVRIMSWNSRTLTFEAPGGGPTAINVVTAGEANPWYEGNSISTNVVLGGGSPLTLTHTSGAGSQMPFSFSNININGSRLTVAGTGGSAVGILGAITGSGTIIKNSTAAMSLASTGSTFSGDIVVNAGQLSMDQANIRTAASMTITGAVKASNASPLGGEVKLGSGNTYDTNAGQRLPAGTLTFKGGYLANGGQNLNGAAAGTVVRDDVATLAFDSGYSQINMTTGTGSGGTELAAATLSRTAGATAFIRGEHLGGTSKVLATNYADHLKGGIVPWMTVSTNQYANGSTTFATYDPATGFRPCDFTGANVQSWGLNLATDTTVNSLDYEGYGDAAFASPTVRLTITSGALSIAQNNRSFGAADAAGIIDFASAEGVIWTIATNTNTINSKIAGSNGITKAGTGTLVLTNAANEYSGTTIVSGGTLQVNSGAKLGAGDLEVASGAMLSLLADDGIADSATVTLANYELKGKINLGAGVNDDIAGLLFGNALQASGTWGSTLSSADHKDDAYFTGTGVLNVVPEPTSFALFGLAAMALFPRRARRK